MSYVSPKKPIKVDTSIMLPEEYLKWSTEAEEQIRILLAIRRYRYTRVAVEPPGLTLKMPAN